MDLVPKANGRGGPDFASLINFFPGEHKFTNPFYSKLFYAKCYYSVITIQINLLLT